MPELPEVENVVRELKKNILGRIIVNVKLNSNNFRDVSFSGIENKKINDIKRKGKYIFFFIEDKVMIVHLRMTGKFLFEKVPGYVEKVTFEVKDRKMYFYDIRNFATINIQDFSDYREKKPYISIGPDLVNNYIDIESIHKTLSMTKAPIKASILNQKIFSGIGNIYASEILFVSKINPFLPSNLISKSLFKEMIENSKKILLRSIELGGTSIVDFISPEGNKGRYQNELKVYGREGKPCLVCKELISKENIDQRSTFFCIKCQNIPS